MAVQSTNNIPVFVEILINGSWVDISTFVYQRNDIAIDGGQSDEQQQPLPSTMTLTLMNNDGRFSPQNTGGAYFPFLLREVQIRVSINGRSSTGQGYFGYRFWGSVPNWPPGSDITGRDAYVNISASGPLRRVNAGGGIGSALKRYYQSLTGQFVPIAYWPCEEDPTTLTSIQNAVTGGTPMLITGGPPVFKGSKAFDGSSPLGVVNKSTWDGLTGQFNSSGDDVFIGPGTFTWVSPVSTVDARLTGPGGGGASADSFSGKGGMAGGGGELAREATAAVTPGKAYKFTLPKGGDGGGITFNAHSKFGTDGANASIALDAVTLSAHGGQGGTTVPGPGGTGSTNGAHQNGGTGGHGGTFNVGQGAGGGGGGGGGSGGTTGAGGTGGDAPASPNNHGGAAGAAGAGSNSAAGGAGGNANPIVSAGGAGGVPGGGGGGGGLLVIFGAEGYAGGSGAPCKAEFIYPPATTPPGNFIRFVCSIPKHGANPGKVLFRVFTGGTVHQIDATYNAGGTITFVGKNNVGTQLFNTGALTVLPDGTTDGVPFMVTIELTASGANVSWFIGLVRFGQTGFGVGNFQFGSVTTASMGNVTEVLVSPNADITKTAVGHITVQYAAASILSIVDRLNGHTSEMTIDRFVRLANETALDAVPAFNEKADHWGFEKFAHTAQGTPLATNYYIAAQSVAQVNVGDRIIITTNFMTGDDTGFEGGTIGSWVPNSTGGNCTLANSTAAAKTGTHSLSMTSVAAGNMSAVWNPAFSAMLPVNPGDIVQVAAWLQASTVGRNCQLEIHYFDANNNFISTTVVGAGADVTGSMSQLNGQEPVGAPANAVVARGVVDVLGTAGAGEVHLVDDIVLANITQVYKVTNVGAPFAGFVNVFFAPPLQLGNNINQPPNNTNMVTSAEPPNIGTPVVAANPAISFQGSTQGWSGSFGTVAATTNFNTDSYGFYCLTLTASGAGQPAAFSPSGTRGQPVAVGDIVSAAVDINTPAALNHVFVGIQWFQSNGTACAHAEDDSADFASAAGQTFTLKVKATAPATAAFFDVVVGDHNVDPVNTVINIDNVRVTPRMGLQTRKELKEFLKELKALDAGILRESRTSFGLGYRTRISLMYQTPVCTLDYSAGHLASPDGANSIKVVQDDFLIKTTITAKRHRGATVTVTGSQNQINAIIPPNPQPPKNAQPGTVYPGFPFIGTQDFVAEADEQLVALANHLLTLGTDPNERIPELTLDMTRAAVANLWSSIAQVEMGDAIQINNMPSWSPNNPIKQMVIGYHEVINAFKWTITWNCRPYYPFTITVQSVPRRW